MGFFAKSKIYFRSGCTTKTNLLGLLPLTPQASGYYPIYTRRGKQTYVLGIQEGLSNLVLEDLSRFWEQSRNGKLPLFKLPCRCRRRHRRNTEHYHPILSPSLQFSRLEGESCTSNTNNGSLDVAAAKESVAVRNSLESSGKGGVGRTSEVIVSGVSIASIGGVERVGDTREYIRLNEELSAITGVDAVVGVQEVAVDDMAGSEAVRWRTRVDVVPVVVGIGDGQMARILVAIAVRVTDERGLPVVVDVAVGDGDIVASVGDIDETIVVVLVVVPVGRDIDMVDPHVGGGLDADSIAVVRENLLDRQVANNDVLLALDVETQTNEFGAGVLANDALVRADLNLGSLGNGAGDDDDTCGIVSDGCGKLSVGGNGSGGSALSSSGSAVQGSITDSWSISDRGTLSNVAALLILNFGRDGKGNLRQRGQTRCD